MNVKVQKLTVLPAAAMPSLTIPAHSAPAVIINFKKRQALQQDLSFLTLKCNYPIQPTPIGTTVCTVDLLIPNFFAVSLTVALVWIINFATSTALSSIYVFKPSTPLSFSWLCICKGKVSYFWNHERIFLFS